MSEPYHYDKSVATLPVLPDAEPAENHGRKTPDSDAPAAVPPVVVSDLTNTAPEPSPETAATPADATPSVHAKLIEGKVIEAVRSVYDPEIPVNIYELGLIYEIKVAPDDSVHVKMTLTSPMCPVAGSLPGEVETKIEAISEVKSATVELVWDPPWSRDCISEAALLQLGMM